MAATESTFLPAQPPQCGVPAYSPIAPGLPIDPILEITSFFPIAMMS